MQGLALPSIVVGVMVVVGGCEQRARGPGASAPVARASLDAAAPAPPPGDASTAAITLLPTGLSVIAGYQRIEDEAAILADLQTKLAVQPGLTVGWGVVEYADEHEEGYWSVKQGEVEVAQLFRHSLDRGLEVRVLGAVFPTTDGLRVGDKAATLFARRPGLTCVAIDDSELGLLQCAGARADLRFILDASGYKGKRSGPLPRAAIGDRAIYMIVANAEAR